MRAAARAVTDAGVDAWASERLGAARAERLRSLAADPGVPPFFGRTDSATETFHIGRRHVRDAAGDPVVIDWRAPMSRPFYQASAAEPQGLVRRRRFGFAGGELTGYEDELLGAGDDRESAFLPRGDRAPAQRADARHRRHHPARAGRHRARAAGRVDLRPGRAGHGQDRGRAAPGGLPALHARRPARPHRRPGRRAQPGVPALHRAGAAHPRRGRRRADDGRRSSPPGCRCGRWTRRRRRAQGRRPDGRGAAPGAVGRDRQARRRRAGAAGRPPLPRAGRAAQALRRRPAPPRPHRRRPAAAALRRGPRAAGDAGRRGRPPAEGGGRRQPDRRRDPPRRPQPRGARLLRRRLAGPRRRGAGARAAHRRRAAGARRPGASWTTTSRRPCAGTGAPQRAHRAVDRGRRGAGRRGGRPARADRAATGTSCSTRRRTSPRCSAARSPGGWPRAR